MATHQQTLIDERNRVADALAAMPIKPDYSKDGQSVSWMNARSSLIQQLEQLDMAIQRAEGPFEVRSAGY